MVRRLKAVRTLCRGHKTYALCLRTHEPQEYTYVFSTLLPEIPSSVMTILSHHLYSLYMPLSPSHGDVESSSLRHQVDQGPKVDVLSAGADVIHVSAPPTTSLISLFLKLPTRVLGFPVSRFSVVVQKA